jgi:hypothetical protein
LFFPNLIYYNRLPLTGHFLALEDPELFARELVTFVDLLLKKTRASGNNKDEL